MNNNAQLNENFIPLLPCPPPANANDKIIIVPKKKCGRKRVRDPREKNTEQHNKYSDDNLLVKAKYLLMKNLLDFINKKIIVLYNNNIGKGVFKKELQILNRSQQSNSSINYNKLLINKTIEEIFSEKISSRYTNFPPYHNKTIIQTLKKEQDEKKNIYFNKLFNLTFMECLDHFIGKIFIDELNGLKTFGEIKASIALNCEEDREKYIGTLEKYLSNFEENINNKKARKSRKLKM
jgi:hypothetical protein